jgi:HEAT repeat protein
MRKRTAGVLTLFGLLAAATAFGHETSGSTVQALAERLGAAEAAERREAARALSGRGAEAAGALDALFAALADPDPDVRALAFEAVGVLDRSTPADRPLGLERKFGDLEAGEVDIVVGLALQRKPPEAQEAAAAWLVQGLESWKNLALRHGAVWLLGYLGVHSDAAAAAVVEASRGEDPALSSGAAMAFRVLGPRASAAVPDLIASLRRDPMAERGPASRSLTHIGPPAIPALLETLEAEDNLVSVSARVALAGMREKALPALHERLRTGQPRQRADAIDVLASMRDRRGQAQPALLESLPAIVGALDDPDPEVRLAVVHALRVQVADQPELVAALRKAAEDADESVRAEAVHALSLLGNEP